MSHFPESFDVPLGCLSEVCSEKVIREYMIIWLYIHIVFFSEHVILVGTRKHYCRTLTTRLITVHMMATTRCQYAPGHTHPLDISTSLDIPNTEHTHALDLLTPKRDLGPGITSPRRDLVTVIPTPLWTRWQTPVETLPSRNYCYGQ